MIADTNDADCLHPMVPVFVLDISQGLFCQQDMAVRVPRVLRRAYQARDGGARQLRQMHFAQLGLDSASNFGARFSLASPHLSVIDAPESLVTLDVVANDATVLQLLRLHLYGMVEPLTNTDASPPPTAAYRRAVMSLGAMPSALRQAPTFLDASVDVFRRANAQRFANVSKGMLSATRTQELAASTTPLNVKHERWSYGTLADGCIALRTVDHPKLEQMDSMQQEIAGAKLLRMRLDPVEKTAYIARRDDGRIWGAFGGDKVPTADDVEKTLLDLLEWSFCSAMVKELRGVWVRGAAVCDATTKDAVLIVGRGRSGKTSMALHCLAAHPDAQFVGSGSCFVFVHPLTHQLMVASLPISPRVRLGTLMGTLHPNPCLIPPDPLVAAAAAHNSLSQIWHSFGHGYRIPIAEAFGFQRCCPTSCLLKSVVMLDWDSDQLELGAQRGISAVKSGEDVESAVSFMREAKTFTSHPLLEWGCYDGSAHAAEKLLAAMAETHLPQLHRVGGDVAFGKVTRFIMERVMGKRPDSLTPSYQRCRGV
jgi:hypothetical protein